MVLEIIVLVLLNSMHYIITLTFNQPGNTAASPPYMGSLGLELKAVGHLVACL